MVRNYGSWHDEVIKKKDFQCPKLQIKRRRRSFVEVRSPHQSRGQTLTRKSNRLAASITRNHEKISNKTEHEFLGWKLSTNIWFQIKNMKKELRSVLRPIDDTNIFRSFLFDCCISTCQYKWWRPFFTNVYQNENDFLYNPCPLPKNFITFHRTRANNYVRIQYL